MRLIRTNDGEAAAEWVDIALLTPWSANPRKNEAAVPEVMASIRRFGFASPIIARKADGEVIAGHTRLEAARRLGLDRVPVRYMDLDPADAHLLAIADNKLGEIAEWDEQALADILREIDVGEATEGLGFDEGELRELLGAITDDGESSSDEKTEESKYTRKIQAPIYEIHGEKPKPSDLYHTDKTKSLLDAINKCDMSDDVRCFLVAAAHRHTVFDFRHIAEFYAHAEPEIQRLMEQSALVVIDFDDAIANGFVRMSQRLGALVDDGEASDD
jgi:hypothetical protein